MKRDGFALLGLALGLAPHLGGCRSCTRPEAHVDVVRDAAAAPVDAAIVADALSAPIGGAHLSGGGLLVAGVDRTSKTLRVGRLDAQGRISEARTVLSEIALSKDAEVRVFGGPGAGATVLWRGLHRGRFARTLVRLGPDLSPMGESVEIPGQPCVTRDAIWTLDGQRVTARPLDGAAFDVTLPNDDDVSLVCSASRAYAVIDQDEGASAMVLTKGRSEPKSFFRERDFGDDEQRERAEYLVGEDLGFVRIGSTGSVVVRELSASALRAQRMLKTRLPKDDDVVAVEASDSTLVIVYTEEASGSCRAHGSGDESVSTKVMALVVDRRSNAEKTLELAQGSCGHELGPFFTGTLGDRVTVAWGEHASGIGHARAPLVAVNRATIGGSLSDAGPATRERTELQADALVDVGCDGTVCELVAVSTSSSEEPARLRVISAR